MGIGLLPELLIGLVFVAIFVNWFRHREQLFYLGRQIKGLFDPKSKW